MLNYLKAMDGIRATNFECELGTVKWLPLGDKITWRDGWMKAYMLSRLSSSFPCPLGSHYNNQVDFEGPQRSTLWIPVWKEIPQCAFQRVFRTYLEKDYSHNIFPGTRTNFLEVLAKSFSGSHNVFVSKAPYCWQSSNRYGSQGGGVGYLQVTQEFRRDLHSCCWKKMSGEGWHSPEVCEVRDVFSGWARP